MIRGGGAPCTAASRHVPRVKGMRMADPEPYRISPAVVSRAVADETVIVDLDTETYFGLNRVGSAVWAGLEEGTCATTIAQMIADRFDVSLQAAHDDILAFVADLR